MTRSRIALLITLALWVTGSLLPKARLWGLGFLDQAPTWMWIVAIGFPFLIAISVGPPARYSKQLLHRSISRLRLVMAVSEKDSPPGALNRNYITIAVVTGLLLFCSFILLKQTTHFLGDGSLQLFTLALEDPVVKGHEAGTVHTLLAIKGLFGSGEGAALAAYRMTSYVSGLILILFTFVLAARVFDSRAQALFFSVGHLSGGFMLLYFGYVENYALFVLSTSLFVLTGMGVCRRKINRWWVLIPFAACIWFHSLGWALLPALIYVVLVHTPISYRLRNLGIVSRASLAILTTATVAGLFYWKYTTDFIFRFTFLPPLADRFTVDNYTLFSPNHLIDLGNLYLLLVPGLLVAITFAWRNPNTSAKRDSAKTYLWLAFVGTAISALVVYPRLGMPRDWDLLAFVGVPASMLAYYLIIATESPHAGKVTMLCAVLGFCVLLPRAYVQSSPLPSARLAQGYFTLDPQRSRSGVQVVGQYLLDNDFTAEYGRQVDFRKRTYPEEALRDRLDFLFRDGKMSEAELVCRNITRMNPRMDAAWMFLGFICNNAGRHDSAAFFLEVADGLNPHTTGIINELGRAYFFTHRGDEALELWERSLALDSSQYVPLLAIRSWHEARGDKEEASRLLALAATRPGVPADVYLQLARDHAENNRITEAQVQLDRAVKSKADTLKVQALLREYPRLALPPTETTPAGEPSSDGVSDGA